MKLEMPVFVRSAVPAFVALTALAPATASADGNFDLALYLGTSFPGYSQTFTYSPGPVSVPIPGVSITQSGGFTFDGHGGVVLSGGATVYFGGVFGIEGRYDTVRVGVDELGPKYDVSVTLPGISTPVNASLDLAQGLVDVSALKPWSVNLKLRTPGKGPRFYVSGGISHLPSITFTVNQRIGLGVTGLNAITSQLQIASVGLSGALTPTDGGTGSKWGGNAGAGLQFSLGKNLSLVGEARYFFFTSQSFEWTVTTDRSLSGIEQTLLDATVKRLPPVEFQPRFFHVAGGVTLSF